MPVVRMPTTVTSSSRAAPYSNPTIPIDDIYGRFNTPLPAPGSSPHFARPGNRHTFVCNGYQRGDSDRNKTAKQSIRGINTPVKYIFFAGGHGKMVDDGIHVPTEALSAAPACTTIFPNYLGEKAVSGVSKHTIVANLTALITSKQQQQQGHFSQGDFLEILETQDVQQIGGRPAITVYRQAPLEMMHNLYMFGTGGIHSEDFLNAGTRNPSCLYMVDVATGAFEDLARTVFTDKIAGWRADVGAAVADWDAANPSDPSSGVEKMKKITAANPTMSPKPPDVHYVNSNGSRVTLADVTGVINTKMTELGASPEQCLLYVIACRRCDTSCKDVCRVKSSGGGGKTKKRRRRNRTRSARYRSRQVRRRTKRTKRTKRK